MQNLTQDKIDQLLKNSQVAQDMELSGVEKDALGEAINISMGAAATAISAMLNKKVLITTPGVSVTKTKDFNCKALEPAVGVGISYIKGLDGNNVLMMKQSDIKIVVSLLMGGDGTFDEGELDEMHISAVSEVMNQMMGASSTAMSSFFNRPINISTPTIYMLQREEDSKELVMNEVSEHVICIRFKLTIGDLISSELMSIMSLPFGKELAGIMLNIGKQAAQSESPLPENRTNEKETVKPERSPVKVSNVTYSSFDEEENILSPVLPGNMNLIMDVPLTVSVQIGKTQKPVREILDYTQGSIIELDKQAGDPAEIIVNGQLIARGDIVVIDDNFGIRITEIIPPKD